MLFTSIVEDIKRLIAEKMDYRSLREFAVSSKQGKEIMALTRYRPVIRAEAVSMEALEGWYDISVNFVKDVYKPGNTGVQIFCPFSPYSSSSPYPRFMVSEVHICGVIKLAHIAKLCQRAEFCNSEVKLKLFGASMTSIGFEPFLKLTEMFNITSMVNEEPYGDGPCNVLENAFFDYPPFFELKRLHFAPADFSKFHMLPELKATEIVIRQNCSVEELPRITPTLNVFFKQWFRHEREIDWLRIVIRNRNPEDSAEILFFELSPYIVWQKNETRSDYLKLLKNTHLHGKTQRLERGDVVYILERGDKKLLVLVKNFCEIIAQEFTDLNDILVFNAPW